MLGSDGVIPPDSVGVAFGEGKLPLPTNVGAGLEGILGSDGVVPPGSVGVAFGACDEPSVGEAFGDGNVFPVGSEAGA